MPVLNAEVIHISELLFNVLKSASRGFYNTKDISISSKKLSTCEDVKLSIVVQMIQSVLNAKNQLYLFIDLGRIHSYSDDGEYLEHLLAISNIHNSTPRLLFIFSQFPVVFLWLWLIQ